MICMNPLMIIKFPHLLENTTHLKPIVIFPSNRTGVWMVMGLSTIMRESNTYLIKTVGSLIDNIHKDDFNQCLIVVLISEVNNRTAYIQYVVNEFRIFFQDHLDSGLLELVAVPEGFYPPLVNMTPSFQDTKARAAWRTKQNLDYIFLMMYSINRGTYYLQLEDDILASPLYTSKMRRNMISTSANWFILEFSKIGFIGKLFNRNSLERTIEFLIMFYDDKPCDWLLHNLFELYSGCSIIYDCKLKRIYAKPSLFQHIGLYSSLSGKIQKVKAHDFKGGDTRNSENPPARLSTTLVMSRKDFSLEDIYYYVSEHHNFFFWGLNPKLGDFIAIHFFQPTCLERFSMLSGNYNAPSDKFSNVVLEVKRASSVAKDMLLRVDVINNSTNKRTLSAMFGFSFGFIEEIRVTFLSDSHHWIIIKKITVKPCKATTTTEVEQLSGGTTMY